MKTLLSIVTFVTFSVPVFAQNTDSVKVDYVGPVIYFESGKSTLTDAAKTQLDTVAKGIERAPYFVEITGYSDANEYEKYKKSLGNKRAKKVYKYLLSKRMVGKVYLKKKLSVDNKFTNRCNYGVTCTDEEHSKNRRVEVKVLSNYREQPPK